MKNLPYTGSDMRNRITIATGIRYAIVVFALVAYVWLLRFDAQDTFSKTLNRHHSFIVALTDYDFSALVAFICTRCTCAFSGNRHYEHTGHLPAGHLAPGVPT